MDNYNITNEGVDKGHRGSSEGAVCREGLKVKDGD